MIFPHETARIILFSLNCSSNFFLCSPISLNSRGGHPQPKEISGTPKKSFGIKSGLDISKKEI